MPIPVEDNVEKVSVFMSNSEYIIKESNVWCCNRDSYRTRAHHTRFVLSCVDVREEKDSVKAIGSAGRGLTRNQWTSTSGVLRPGRAGLYLTFPCGVFFLSVVSSGALGSCGSVSGGWLALLVPILVGSLSGSGSGLVLPAELC